MKRNSACASSFFCFSSVKKLHCITLLTMATLTFAVFWSSRKLTSLRGPGAPALPPLTIFHSLSALQLGQNGTQMGHRPQQNRRCCIPAQRRRAAMTRPPRAAAAPIKAVLVRADAAVWQLGFHLRSFAFGTNVSIFTFFMKPNRMFE